MARFAWVCLLKTRELTKMLECSLGPDTADVSAARHALLFLLSLLFTELPFKIYLACNAHRLALR